MTGSSVTGSTKKTLQELSKVFNRLASDLNTELGHARIEIETLRKEIVKLRSITSSTSRTTSNVRSSKTGKRSASGTRGTSRSGGNQSATSSKKQSAHGEKQSSPPVIPKTDSEYIFPREPFNPPAPSEPSPPNN